MTCTNCNPNKAYLGLTEEMFKMDFITNHKSFKHGSSSSNTIRYCLRNKLKQMETPNLTL